MVWIHCNWRIVLLFFHSQSSYGKTRHFLRTTLSLTRLRTAGLQRQCSSTLADLSMILLFIICITVLFSIQNKYSIFTHLFLVYSLFTTLEKIEAKTCKNFSLSPIKKIFINTLKNKELFFPFWLTFHLTNTQFLLEEQVDEFYLLSPPP